MNRDFTRYQKLPEVDLRSPSSVAAKPADQDLCPTTSNERSRHIQPGEVCDSLLKRHYAESGHFTP